jgi:hypothetical protein
VELKLMMNQKMMTVVNSLAEWVMTRSDIQYVACPTAGCTGDLEWIGENTIKCNKCAFTDERTDKDSQN